MSRIPTPTRAAIALFAFAACGGSGGPGGDWAGTRRDSAGIAIVENPAEGIWTDADRWTYVEELRIGTMEGDAAYQFGAINGIAGLPDGRIAVLDAQAQEFRVFSAAGEHLRTIGRPGSGPGEFGLGAGPVLVASGDTLLIPDLMNQRLNRYAPDGEPLESVPVAFESAGIPMAWRDRPDGGVVTQLRPFGFSGSRVDLSPNDALVLRGPDGAIRDTLMTFDSGGTIKSGSGGLPEVELFAAEPLWALSGDRIVFAINDDYRLSIYAEDGTLERIFSMPFTVREVTESDRQVMTDAITGAWKSIGLDAEQMAVARQLIHYGETFPALAQIHGGPDGTIWVQEMMSLSELDPEDIAQFAQSPIGSPVWRVFDAEGVLLGEIRMPDRFQPLRFDGDRIYGVQKDDLDVQYVVVLRLNRGS